MSEEDGALGLLVSVVDSTDVGISITLNFQGAVIMGNLVSAERYSDEMIKFLNASKGTLRDSEGRSVFAYLFDRIAEADRERRKRIDEEEPSEELAPRYLHLADAHILTGNSLHPTDERGVFWRGRIDQVAGWTLGNTMAPPEQD